MKHRFSIKLLTLAFASLLLSAGFLTSCHNIMFEKELVVNKVKKGDGQYKYQYYIESFPVDQILYSNEIYQVGDTIKACR